MPENPLVGTWILISYMILNEEGVKIAEPFGPHPQGILIYAADGMMSGQLMATSRSLSRSNIPLRASSEEKIQAFDTYLGYCGTYEYKGDHVIHHVTTSLFPNWVGTDQVRVTHLEGNLLTLTIPPNVGKGKTRTAQITWRRGVNFI